MRKKLMIILMILCSMSVLYGCSKKNLEINNDKSYEMVQEILGTIVSGKAYGEKSKEALEAAFERAEEIQQIMSVKSEESEISYVNSNAAKEPIKVSEELFYVVETALKYSEITEGALDVTIGKLIDLWGIGTENANIPEEIILERYKNKYNYKNVILNSKDKTIYYLNNNIKIDLGAIAKGYIADEMKVILEEANIKSAILNLGGNVITIGKKIDDSKWTVGITDPLNISNLKATVKIDNETVVTSGNYERYFEVDRRRYHHILNPFTAMPAEEGIVSTTIISENSMVADALSTATYILGVDKSLEIIESISGVEGIFITENGEVITTSGIEGKEFTRIEN